MKPEFLNTFGRYAREFRESRRPTHEVFPIPTDALIKPIEDIQQSIDRQDYLGYTKWPDSILHINDYRASNIIHSMQKIRLNLSELMWQPFSNTAYLQGARFAEYALRETAKTKHKPLLSLTDAHIRNWQLDWIGQSANRGQHLPYPMDGVNQALRNLIATAPIKQPAELSSHPTPVIRKRYPTPPLLAQEISDLLTARDLDRLARISPDAEPHLYRSIKALEFQNEKLPDEDFELGVADLYSIYWNAHDIEVINDQWK